MSIEHYEPFADAQGDFDPYSCVHPFISAPDEAQAPFAPCCPLFGFEDEDDLRA